MRSLNPEKIPGRLTLITRQGADNVRENLPPLLAAVRNSGHPVVWACDPMHGNTYTAEGGHKTRHFDRILDEIAGFFAAHRQEEPGRAASTSNSRRLRHGVRRWRRRPPGDSARPGYETMCDPRLNGRQSVDLAFMVAELLQTD